MQVTVRRLGGCPLPLGVGLAAVPETGANQRLKGAMRFNP